MLRHQQQPLELLLRRDLLLVLLLLLQLLLQLLLLLQVEMLLLLLLLIRTQLHAKRQQRPHERLVNQQLLVPPHTIQQGCQWLIGGQRQRGRCRGLVSCDRPLHLPLSWGRHWAIWAQDKGTLEHACCRPLNGRLFLGK